MIEGVRWRWSAPWRPMPVDGASADPGGLISLFLISAQAPMAVVGSSAACAASMCRRMPFSSMTNV